MVGLSVGYGCVKRQLKLCKLTRSDVFASVCLYSSYTGLNTRMGAGKLELESSWKLET